MLDIGCSMGLDGRRGFQAGSNHTAPVPLVRVGSRDWRLRQCRVRARLAGVSAGKERKEAEKKEMPSFARSRSSFGSSCKEKERRARLIHPGIQLGLSSQNRVKGKCRKGNSDQAQLQSKRCRPSWTASTKQQTPS
jgi:hypothetical protein